jgi:hypothetical protein
MPLPLEPSIFVRSLANHEEVFVFGVSFLHGKFIVLCHTIKSKMSESILSFAFDYLLCRLFVNHTHFCEIKFLNFHFDGSFLLRLGDELSIELIRVFLLIRCDSIEHLAIGVVPGPFPFFLRLLVNIVHLVH